jgi:ketosteroid isomerase-like protein
MERSPIEIVQNFLAGRTDKNLIHELCAPDVTYVSLNYDNHDLKKSMPWCGTSHGPEAIFDVFSRVGQYWTVDDFTSQAIFGEAEHVAVFGTMTLTSTVLQKTVTTPFSMWCRVVQGKIQYMQFMEDTFATSSSFRSGGAWRFRSNPAGGEVTV